VPWRPTSAPLERLQRLEAVRGDVEAAAKRAEHVPHDFLIQWVVLHDENSQIRRRHHLRGLARANRKRAVKHAQARERSREISNVNDISTSALGNLGANVRWRLEFQ
jgi:hypothetical protein